jgi:hypothetical protein
MIDELIRVSRLSASQSGANRTDRRARGFLSKGANV